MTPHGSADHIDNPKSDKDPEKKPTAASERQSSSWDIRNAPRNYLSLVAAQAGSALFSFAAVWLITRYMGSEGYGGIVAVIAASQVAQVLVNWTSVAVVRFGVDEFIETEKIARTFWVSLIILSINLLLVSAASQVWFPPLAGWLRLPAGSFWFVLAHFAATAFWIHIQMSLQGAKMPRVQGFLLMTERAVILLLIVALLWAERLDWRAAIVCYIAAPAVMVAAGAYQLRHYISARFAVDRAFVRKIFAYSLPLLPFSLVGYFSGSYVDAVFVSNYLSTRDLGIYSVATQINGVMLQLPTLANSLLLPMFVTLNKESQNERTDNYFRNVLPSMTLLWGLGSSLFAFVCFFAIGRVFSPEFHAAATPLWLLLAASTVGIPMALGFSPLSNAASKTHIAMFGAIISAAVNIAGNAILIPRLGLAGCAWATLLAFLAGALTYAAMLKRETSTPTWRPFAAIVPAIGGGLLLFAWSDPWRALAGCIIISFTIGYFMRGSLGQTVVFLKNRRTAA